MKGAIWVFEEWFKERGLLAVDVRDRRSSKESINPISGEENQRRYKIKTALSTRNGSGEKTQWFRSRINIKELCRWELRAWIFWSKDVNWRIQMVCTIFWSHGRRRRLFQQLKESRYEETKAVNAMPEGFIPDPLIKAKSDSFNLQIFLHRRKKQTILSPIYSLFLGKCCSWLWASAGAEE